MRHQEKKKENLKSVAEGDKAHLKRYTKRMDLGLNARRKKRCEKGECEGKVRGHGENQFLSFLKQSRGKSLLQDKQRFSNCKHQSGMIRGCTHRRVNARERSREKSESERKEQRDQRDAMFHWNSRLVDLAPVVSTQRHICNTLTFFTR